MAHAGKKLTGTTYKGRFGFFTLKPDQTGGEPGPIHATDPATGDQGERIAVTFEKVKPVAAAAVEGAPAKKKAKAK